MPRKKTTDTKVAESKPKTLSPFDVLKMMFENHDAFMKLSEKDLSSNYFIINERMSIQYPMQAAVFNHAKINPAEVVKCWESFIRQQGYTKTPGFIFIQGKKKAAETLKATKAKWPDKLIREYAAKRGISYRDVYAALDLFPDQMSDDLKGYEKILKEIEDAKKMTIADLRDEKDESGEEMIGQGANINDESQAMF